MFVINLFLSYEQTKPVSKTWYKYVYCICQTGEKIESIETVLSLCCGCGSSSVVVVEVVVVLTTW